MSDAEPLTPPDCDLRDFPFMPLDITRLFSSRFHAIADDGQWRAGVTLWLRSFHQVPAGSLPDDDIELARLAEFARDVKAWRKVRAMALHGWIKCTDGRLYHPVVCEKALEAWERKRAQRERSRRGNEARWGKRGDTEGDVSGGMEEDRARPEGAKEDPRAAMPATENRSFKDAAAIPQGHLEGVQEAVPQGLRQVIPETSLNDPKGQGQREGQGRKKEKPERGARGSRLPPSWRPSPENILFAEGLGLDAMAVAAKFRDFWCEKTGQDATKISWDGTWRNWCRRERPTLGKPQKPASKLAYLAEFAPGYGQLNIIDPETETLQ